MIAFDAIWLPIGVTVLWFAWAWLILREPGSSGHDWFVEFSLAVAWPAIPVLGSWLLWAVLT